MYRALTAIIFAATVVGLLGGCASTRMVGSEVNSFARWTPAPPAPGSSYRFERLPSQQADISQARLEGLAQAALARVGLQHNPQAASLSVQVSASSQPMLRSRWDGSYYPYGSPNIFIGGGSGGGGSSVGFGFGMGFPLGGMETPIYRREVSIVMRELRSNVAVYETRAVSEEPWLDTDPVLSAMLDAALRGFPVPPAGPRRVSVEIPR
ncbi:MAG: DUF4136 domain-containing protein [Polaromonas sp.]|uniref:DUF4136 domain-containing protein n=1 Tax=Polaromonas sp. TaxID=1869339 RepID=UPI00272F6D09|nr:DUF4136 domain-containing protein [Polaromonas sp.]MDP2449313.1 DUF4136 domain-containing protein [Polaromonas sp.]MDP3245492.1 DUF4136 domain-containing protein [Polaromonas sp.]